MIDNKPILDNRSVIEKKDEECKVVFGKNVRLIGARIVLAKNAELIVGDNVTIRGFVSISTGCSVNIGSGTRCNFPIYLVVSEGTRFSLGKDCLLSDVSIYTSDTHSIFNKETKEKINKGKDIFIGDRVWLGRRSWVMKGSVIGSDVVVGACSMVIGALPSNTICVGSPATVVKENIVWCPEMTDICPERLLD